MLFDNSSLTQEQFLARHWQRKPLLIRQALPGFVPELDADDIAGLACDEMAESRLITGSYPEHDWRLRYGPFNEQDFSRLPETNWTLLVQDVEKHYPPLQALLGHFSFLPRWRIDDLMVSVAGPGGSVGPHVDQYDVFLLQAEGTRLWQISETCDNALLPDCELNVLREFSAEQEWLLQPGDMLYLPPGVAHHGVAQDQCMTWSIGMRAPSAADLFQSLGEWLAERNDEGGRYRDPDLHARPQPGEIDSSAIDQFRSLLNASDFYENEFPAFLGDFLSRYRQAHEPAGPEASLSPEALVMQLNQGRKLRHNPWTRLLWTRSESGAHLFAAGSGYECSLNFARALCDPDSLDLLTSALSDEEQILVCELINQGHLYLEQL
jgi:50S ribosomal protein L16 3-hydroxylase